MYMPACSKPVISGNSSPIKFDILNRDSFSHTVYVKSFSF